MSAVTRQLQVERRTGKVHRSKTTTDNFIWYKFRYPLPAIARILWHLIQPDSNVLPLYHATNMVEWYAIEVYMGRAIHGSGRTGQKRLGPCSRQLVTYLYTNVYTHNGTLWQ